MNCYGPKVIDICRDEIWQRAAVSVSLECMRDTPPLVLPEYDEEVL